MYSQPLFFMFFSDKIKDAKIIFVVGEYTGCNFHLVSAPDATHFTGDIHCHASLMLFVLPPQVGLALERAPSVRRWWQSTATPTCPLGICSVLRCLLALREASSSRPSCRRESSCPW